VVNPDSRYGEGQNLIRRIVRYDRAILFHWRWKMIASSVVRRATPKMRVASLQAEWDMSEHTVEALFIEGVLCVIC
jgi:hypothetical protein